MTKNSAYRGSIANYLLLFIAGCLLVFIGFGYTSGLLSSWLKAGLSRLYPTPTPSPVATATPSPTATPKPQKTSYVPDDEYVPSTTKGGIVLGAATAAPIVSGYQYATLVYDYRETNTSPWLTRASYDTRYNHNLVMDEVSRSYERRLTLCYYSKSGSTCELGSINPGTYNFGHLVAGITLTYQILADAHGPQITLSSVYYSGSSKCLKVTRKVDDITPESLLKSWEKLDNNDWRELHSEYCVDNNGTSHTYTVKVQDEAGNTTEVSSVY